MNRIRRYFANALMLAAVSVIMRTVSVSFNVYISEKLGSSGMGLFSLIMSVYGFAVTFATSGINLAVVRLVAENMDSSRGNVKRIMVSCLAYTMFFGSIAFLVLFSSAPVIGERVLGDVRTIPSLRMIAISMPFIAVTSALSGYFNGVRRVYKNVVTQILEQGVRITLCIAGLTILAPAGLEYGALAIVGGGAIAELISFLTALSLYLYDLHHNFEEGKCASDKLSGKSSKIKEVISIAFPIALSAYARSGLITAEHLAIPWGLKKHGATSEGALSSYGIIHGMVMPVILFPSAVLGAFSGLLIPEVAECRARGDFAGIRYIAGRVFQVSLLFSIGVSGVFIAFSNELGMTIYQSSEAVVYIKLIAPLIPVMYLDSAVDSMLKGLGEQLHSMKINILDASVSLILVIILLPRIGIYGYIVVIFVCEILNIALSICRLLTVIELDTCVFKWVIKPLVSIIISTAGTRFLFSISMEMFPQNDAFGCFMKITIAVLAYIAVLMISGSVSRDDILWAKKIFRT